MKVVAPHCVDSVCQERARGVAVVLGDQRGPRFAGAREVRERAQNVWVAAGFEFVRRIESQSVEAETVQPVVGVAQYQPPKWRFPQRWRLTPSIGAFGVEVRVGKRR